MFKGLRTVVYHVFDLAASKAWWTKILGQEPYFDQPFYVGYNVGGYELGLHPVESKETVGAIAYWGVDDVQASFDRLVNDEDCVAHQLVQDVGDGIRLAAVRDDAGNVIGLIENPHFSLPAAR